jgi:hypothetical protein
MRGHIARKGNRYYAVVYECERSLKVAICDQ